MFMCSLETGSKQCAETELANSIIHSRWMCIVSHQEHDKRWRDLITRGAATLLPARLYCGAYKLIRTCGAERSIGAVGQKAKRTLMRRRGGMGGRLGGLISKSIRSPGSNPTDFLKMFQ